MVLLSPLFKGLTVAFLEKMPTMGGWRAWLYEVGILFALAIS